MAAPKYWLMKSEPDVYSIEDLRKAGSDHWEGIRNYQARNFLREMAVGDMALFYHSNAKPPGVAGVARICRLAYPDHTQFDTKSKYFDAKSSPDDPRWSMVDVEFVEVLPNYVSLQDLRDDAELEDLQVLRKGQRLSIQPVSRAHFNRVLKLGKSKTPVR
ncbi:MAG: EVE domain-containing protein [Myxococcales bacterium]|nr:EVE domain-containing protein [Myxococcales bacterium]